MSTGAILQTGLSFLIYTPRNSGIGFMVTLPEYRYEFHTNTKISINQWYLVTGTYHPTEVTRVYLNGRLENEVTPFAEINKAANQRHWGAMLGIRDSNPQEWEINGHIDEFKYFYKVLSTTG